ncbi:MAG: hypothetical protein ACK5QX_07980 [bacterium]
MSVFTAGLLALFWIVLLVCWAVVIPFMAWRYYQACKETDRIHAMISGKWRPRD